MALLPPLNEEVLVKVDDHEDEGADVVYGSLSLVDIDYIVVLDIDLLIDVDLNVVVVVVKMLDNDVKVTVLSD